AAGRARPLGTQPQQHALNCASRGDELAGGTTPQDPPDHGGLPAPHTPWAPLAPGRLRVIIAGYLRVVGLRFAGSVVADLRVCLHSALAAARVLVPAGAPFIAG